ncbi:MAG: phosphotransferase [Alphaproteobacteria bacterium]|nr:phosphotransferase [Alphaproteobacteria bacterium]
METEQEYLNIIKKNFPEIDIKNFRVLGKGSFGVACLVNDDVVFKIPFDFSKRFNDGKKENYILKKLENKLSIEIPRILYNKETEIGIINGETFVHGTTYTQEMHDSFDENTKSDVLRQIGHIMRELHGVKITDEENILFVSDYKDELYLFDRNFPDSVQDCFSKSDKAQINALRDRYEYLSVKYPVDLVLVHADMHFGNFMFDTDNKKIIGLLDFGAAHFAEPARDMHYYYGNGIKDVLSGYGDNGDVYLGERQKYHSMVNFLYNIRNNIENKKSPDNDIRKLLSIL